MNGGTLKGTAASLPNSGPLPTESLAKRVSKPKKVGGNFLCFLLLLLLLLLLLMLLLFRLILSPLRVWLLERELADL